MKLQLFLKNFFFYLKIKKKTQIQCAGWVGGEGDQSGDNEVRTDQAKKLIPPR